MAGAQAGGIIFFNTGKGRENPHWTEEMISGLTNSKGLIENHGPALSSVDIIHPMQTNGNFSVAEDQSYVPKEPSWTCKYEDWVLCSRNAAAQQLPNGHVIITCGFGWNQNITDTEYAGLVGHWEVVELDSDCNKLWSMDSATAFPRSLVYNKSVSPSYISEEALTIYNSISSK
eukprot:gene5827-7029_t